MPTVPFEIPGVDRYDGADETAAGDTYSDELEGGWTNVDSDGGQSHTCSGNHSDAAVVDCQ